MKTKYIVFYSATVFWIVMMGMIYYTHFMKESEPELGYFSSDVKFDTGTKRYFGLYKSGKKTGYRTVSKIVYPGTIVYSAEDVFKVNMAGISREVYFQEIAGIDSVTGKSSNFQFTLHSGSHLYHCEGKVKNDSLFIEIRNNIFSPIRKGAFPLYGDIVYPVTLLSTFKNAQKDSLNLNVFDPLIFSFYTVRIEKAGKEKIKIDGQDIETTKYLISSSSRKAQLWIDIDWDIIKASGDYFFSGIFGEIDMENSQNKNVFLLPLETDLGNDIVINKNISCDKVIENPRETEFIKVQLDSIRAANFDVSASNKEVFSFNPVVIGIHNKAVLDMERLSDERVMARADTSIRGSSDYIQSKDARMKRAAMKIAGDETDTLKVCVKINKWIQSNMKKESGLNIARSIDVLKEMRGGADEYTKLFTALTRSIKVPTQVNLGLVYEDGSFHYASWPSVFIKGVWINMDPYMGQIVADATHISLIRGDYERLIDYMRLIDRISLKILEYR